ncbi:Tyrosineprotein kinase Abllike, partial [Caligus rogercresseyi]
SFIAVFPTPQMPSKKSRNAGTSNNSSASSTTQRSLVPKGSNSKPPTHEDLSLKENELPVLSTFGSKDSHAFLESQTAEAGGCSSAALLSGGQGILTTKSTVVQLRRNGGGGASGGKNKGGGRSAPTPPRRTSSFRDSTYTDADAPDHEEQLNGIDRIFQ